MTVTEFLILTLWLTTAGSLALFILAYVGNQPGPVRCRACGYDLSGCQSDRCSECGREIGVGDRYSSRVVNTRHLRLFASLTLIMALVDVTAAIVWPPFWPEQVPTRWLILFDDAFWGNRSGPKPSAVRQEMDARMSLPDWSPREEEMVLRRQMKRLCERDDIGEIRQKWPADRPLRVKLNPHRMGSFSESGYGPFWCGRPYVFEIRVLEADVLTQKRVPGQTDLRIHSSPRPGSSRWSDGDYEIPWSSVNGHGEFVLSVRAYEQLGPGRAFSKPVPGDLLVEELVKFRVRRVESLHDAIKPLEVPRVGIALGRCTRLSYWVIGNALTLEASFPPSVFRSGAALAFRYSVELDGEELAFTRFRMDRRKFEGDWVRFSERLELSGDMDRLRECAENGEELQVRITGDGDLALNDVEATHYWQGEFVMPLEIRLPTEQQKRIQELQQKQPL